MAKQKQVAQKIEEMAKTNKSGLKKAQIKTKKMSVDSKKKSSTAISKSKQDLKGSMSKALAEVKERKKQRFKPGTVVLREIKRYQKTTDMILPAAPFQRVVREIFQEIDPDLKIQ